MTLTLQPFEPIQVRRALEDVTEGLSLLLDPGFVGTVVGGPSVPVLPGPTTDDQDVSDGVRFLVEVSAERG